MASSSSQHYPTQTNAAPIYSQQAPYQPHQMRYSTPPIMTGSMSMSASSPLSIQSPMMSSQSIQSPIMISSYQQQHSSGGNTIPHSPKPPSGGGGVGHYNQIQSPMQVQQQQHYSNQIQSPMPPQQYNLHSPMTPSFQQQQQQPQQHTGQSQYNIQSPMSTASHQQYPQHIHSPMPPSSSSSISSPMMQQPQLTSSHHMHSPLMSSQMTYAQSPLHSNQTIINSPMSSAPIGQHTSYSNVNSPLASSNSNVMYSNAANYGQQTYSNVTHGNYAMPQSFETRTNDNMDQYYLQQQQLKQQQMLLMQQRDREQREREYILHQQQLQIEREKRQREEQRKRFLVELEFVQCLANPSYLHFLAKQGLFDNAAFKNYLKYLLYWKRPEYIRFIKYPECLFFLELIQREEMHESMKSPSCVSFISQQQLLHWQHYARNRDVNLSSSLNEISEQEDDSEEDDEDSDIETKLETKRLKTLSDQNAESKHDTCSPTLIPAVDEKILPTQKLTSPEKAIKLVNVSIKLNKIDSTLGKSFGAASDAVGNLFSAPPLIQPSSNSTNSKFLPSTTNYASNTNGCVAPSVPFKRQNSSNALRTNTVAKNMHKPCSSPTVLK